MTPSTLETCKMSCSSKACPHLMQSSRNEHCNPIRLVGHGHHGSLHSARDHHLLHSASLELRKGQEGRLRPTERCAMVAFRFQQSRSDEILDVSGWVGDPSRCCILSSTSSRATNKENSMLSSSCLDLDSCRILTVLQSSGCAPTNRLTVPQILCVS